MAKFENQNNKKIMIAGIVIFLIVIIFSASKLFRKTTPVQSQIATAQKSQDLNKEFTFPIKSSTDEEMSRIKFVIQKAEENSEIVIKGQKATAVTGRTFLIVELKITNSIDKSIQINTRDYVRLIVNGDEKGMLAPDIHNDPVEVQAISTKYTRVGFPVNTTDRDFTLQIGEIKGNKEKIKLDIK